MVRGKPTDQPINPLPPDFDYDNNKDGDNASLRETPPEDFTNPTGVEIPGYRKQSAATLHVVKFQKEWEERALRHLDWLETHPGVDRRWLAIARTGFEKSFMAVNRALLQPGRIALPEDAEPDKLAANQKPFVEARNG
jgi:hypothetical protein